jgi:phosphoribosylamine--glycine ligase
MAGLRVLIVGGGGREHALAWALSRSPSVARIFVAPGNAGTEWPSAPGCAPCANVSIGAEDIPALRDFASAEAVDLTVVGPEVPLEAGIVDVFQAAGLRIFGPSRAAAQIEASKAFAKSIMREKAIPTASYSEFDDLAAAEAYIRRMDRPLVVKADGLAAGKGVLVGDTTQDALDAVRLIMGDRAFGAAGSRVLIEERLEGPEISVLAFCDGRTAVLMPPARDHKRVFDGDRGPNTGGMGAYAPVAEVSTAMLETIRLAIVQPAVDALAERDTPFVGVLFAGLMLTADGPKTLEFNARFGDPETQAILPLLESDLLDVILACLDGRLNAIDLRWRSGECATVVAASPGYPGAYPKGHIIHGLENIVEAQIFHAGTARSDGQIVTSGGRVLAISAAGADLDAALKTAYAAIGQIHFDGMHFRTDIGQAR